jgi:hypothetical protein
MLSIRFTGVTAAFRGDFSLKSIPSKYFFQVKQSLEFPEFFREKLVMLPAASRGASLAQLELKLCRSLRYAPMMLNVFLSHFTSHAIPIGS